jgi:uncharacterized protein
MPDLPLLEAHLRGLGRVLLGYSGGVDSALLAVVATRALGPERFLAVIGRSPSYPEVQYRAALAIAKEFAIPLREVDTSEMDDPAYVANPTNRCYFCKHELWARLQRIAAAEGYDAIVDGTNADDLGEHRPGLRAAAEWSVASPLAAAGWRKQDIREAARTIGLPIWDAPAAPCLSSRIRYGLSVTPQRLRQVEDGEAWLRSFGVTGDLRVRHHGDRVRIEVAPDWIAVLRERWIEVEAAFRDLGLQVVELDPAGYRRGSMILAAESSTR